MFDYDIDAKNAVEVLDKYDFTDALKNQHGIAIYDVIDILKSYSDEVKDALDNLTEDEVGIYLNKRYKVTVKEISHYCIYWNYQSGKVDDYNK